MRLAADFKALRACFGHVSGCRRPGWGPYRPEDFPKKARPSAASRFFNWSFERRLYDCTLLAIRGVESMARSSLPSPAGRLIGYARVSTDDQSTDAQLAELRGAGCDEIVEEHASGASRARPALVRLLNRIDTGDTLVVVRLDRLARSVSHLLTIIEELDEKRAHFRSLRDPIETTTPQGRFSLQVLGAVAELERSLISERTKAGIKAAQARGRRPGNPGVRSRDPKMLRKLASGRDRTYFNRLLKDLDPWIPTIRALRPRLTWAQLSAYLRTRGIDWPADRLRKACARLVKEKLLDAVLLDRTKFSTHSSRIESTISGILAADPDLSLRDIARLLQEMGEKTPRGGDIWQASTIKLYADRIRPQTG